MITFSEVPNTARIPGSYIELNTRLAARGLPQSDAKVVLVGQRTSTGTAAAGEVKQILSDTDAADYWGQGSMMHRLALAAMASNRYMASLYGVAVDDLGGGVAAHGTFTVSVSSPTEGTLRVWIGDDVVEIVLDGTETTAEIASDIRAALLNAPDLPIVPTVATNVVTVTAANKGTLGNQLDLDWEYSGTGVTLTVAAMASGAGDVDPDDALDVIHPLDVDIIVFPWNDATNLGKLVTHLSARSDGVEQRGAVGITAIDGTVSAVTAITIVLNAGRVSCAALEGTPTWAPEIAAAYAAAIAGEPDLARPLNGVNLNGVYPPEISYRYTRSELTTLLANGVTPLVVNANESVEICRSITTYVKDDSGALDDTLLDLQTIRVLDYLRRALKQRFLARFAQVKIANVAHTENTTDCKKIKAEVLDVLKALEAIDYIEAVDANRDDVIVERNSTNSSRVDCRIPADVVNGLHILAARVDLIL